MRAAGDASGDDAGRDHGAHARTRRPGLPRASVCQRDTPRWRGGRAAPNHARGGPEGAVAHFQRDPSARSLDHRSGLHYLLREQCPRRRCRPGCYPRLRGACVLRSHARRRRHHLLATQMGAATSLPMRSRLNLLTIATTSLNFVIIVLCLITIVQITA